MVKFALVIMGLLLICNTALASEYTATDAGADMVAKGVQKAFIAAADNMYAVFENNTAINEEFGTVRGALFTIMTHIPDPYSIPDVQKLYKNYNALAVYIVVLFILGEFMNRNLARMKVTDSIFGNKDLSTSKFIGGITMCFIGLFANFIFMGALKITEALSQYAMFTVMESIAPSPDNFITYLGMAICDLCVMGFFIIRWFVLIAFAIVCTFVAVLWVPEPTRGFAQSITENVIRILALQPVAIFTTSIGILGLKALPQAMQPLGYIGLTVFIFIMCWYMLTGDFEFIKKGGKMLLRAGVAL